MSNLTCRDDGARREDVRPTKLFGLDFVEVADGQLELDVYFLGRAPEKIEAANVRITGGETITAISVKGITVIYQKDKSLDDVMQVALWNYGDYSTYTLDLVKTDKDGNPTNEKWPGFDPIYGSVDFSFKASCPTDQDCKPEPVCPPPPREAPEINYLAKDYASFRQLILDRLAITMPDWSETHVPDLGITLVELLAYVGDHLSYYQDAVATEAYLGTSRQRISVRRHARLVDYAMHEGCNARAWVTVATDAYAALDPREIYFCTAFPGAPDNAVLQPADIAKAPPESFETFAPLVADDTKPIEIYPAHSAIDFYSWGNHACCLPKGATSATLTDTWIASTQPSPPAPTPTPTPTPAPDPTKPNPDKPAPAPASVPALESAKAPVKSKDGEPENAQRALHLAVGDVLIFEEVVGPKTGDPADADPTHRQAVRLTKVTRGIDPLYHPFAPEFGQPVLEIEWCSEDALAFPLCISAKLPPPDCTMGENISVARGNVILVDNRAPAHEDDIGTVGLVTSKANCPSDCEPREVIRTPAKFRAILSGQPLTFSQPLPPCGCVSQTLPQDPRQALPCVSLTGTLQTPEGPRVTQWTAKADLLESGPGDTDFVVEMDDNGFAHLRFGNGREGRMPDAGTVFSADYSLGNGPSGNVGAETIVYAVFREVTGNIGKLRPRNPLAATGGTAPEPIADVKLFAPYAFRDTMERAVTADDYGALASDNERRLSERPRLISAAAAPPPAKSTLPAPSADDPRAADEEEEGVDMPPLPADLCLIPFERLQKAKAALRWTGSWYEAQVCLDPLGREGADGELCAEIDAYLEPYRRIGHDLNVRQALYAPLDIALSICVAPNILRGHVETALLAAFSNRMLPGGRLGFFHVDNMTFGTAIYASRIVAVAQAIAGVTEVKLLRLERYEPGATPARAPKHFGACDDHGASVPAVLTMAPFEIACLDNDPSSPGRGRLTLYLRGGR
jgi:hypothetical protein